MPRIAVLLLSLAALSACGNGGDSKGVPDTTTVTTEVPATTTSVPLTPLDEYEARMWDLFDGWPAREQTKMCELVNDPARVDAWHAKGDNIGLVLEAKYADLQVTANSIVNKAFPYHVYWRQVGDALRRWCSIPGNSQS